MQTLVLVAAFVALLVAIGVAVRTYLLVKRLDELVESEVSSTIRQLDETVRGVRGTLGKLDEGVESLASALARVDRATEQLEPDSLARTMAQPALRKLASWLGGLRRGLASARGGKPRKTASADDGETEAG